MTFFRFSLAEDYLDIFFLNYRIPTEQLCTSQTKAVAIIPEGLSLLYLISMWLPMIKIIWMDDLVRSPHKTEFDFSV